MKRVKFWCFLLSGIIFTSSCVLAQTEIDETWKATFHTGDYYPGDNFNDFATHITCDEDGNVYVTGYITPWGEGAVGLDDFMTVKYNSEGVYQWSARYAGEDANIDQPAGVIVDDDGNVYVTGKTRDSNQIYSYITIKYSSSGDEQWQDKYKAASDQDDIPVDIAIDKDGYIYVTGESNGPNYATIKYNSEGVRQWVSRYEGPSDRDLATAMAVDDSGNVYVTGRSQNEDAHYDYTTVKYNNSGVEQWVVRYGGSNDEYSYIPADIAVDATGNVYVTGKSDDEMKGFTDIATVKYDADGIKQWDMKYNGAAGDYDEGMAVSIDPSGDVIVTGFTNNDTDADYITIKYRASDGQQLWTAIYNGTEENGNDFPVDISVDSAGYIYVVGTSEGDMSGEDYVTLKYSNDGTPVWLSRYENMLGDFAAAITLNDNGEVFVTGYSIDVDNVLNQNDYLTLKYPGTQVTPTATPTEGPTATPTTGITVTPTPVRIMTPRADINEDGCVNSEDLIMLMDNWGLCE